MLKHVILIFYCFFLSQASFSQKSDVEMAGDIFLIAVPASAFLTSSIKLDGLGLWKYTKGFIINYAVTQTLKNTTRKRRPDDSNNKSFPSAHTSITFQAASYLHKRYGFKYSIPAYLAAGFTGFSRLDAKRHDGFDVLAGAAVGIGSTLLFTNKYEKRKKRQVNVSLFKQNSTYLLGLTCQF